MGKTVQNYCWKLLVDSSKTNPVNDIFHVANGNVKGSHIGLSSASSTMDYRDGGIFLGGGGQKGLTHHQHLHSPHDKYQWQDRKFL